MPGTEAGEEGRGGGKLLLADPLVQVTIFAMTMVMMSTLTMMGNKQIFLKSENLFRQWLVANRAPPTVKIVEEHFYGGLSVSALNMMVKLGRYWKMNEEEQGEGRGGG